MSDEPAMSRSFTARRTSLMIQGTVCCRCPQAQPLAPWQGCERLEQRMANRVPILNAAVSTARGEAPIRRFPFCCRLFDAKSTYRVTGPLKKRLQPENHSPLSWRPNRNTGAARRRVADMNPPNGLIPRRAEHIWLHRSQWRMVAALVLL